MGPPGGHDSARIEQAWPGAGGVQVIEFKPRETLNPSSPAASSSSPATRSRLRRNLPRLVEKVRGSRRRRWASV